MWDQLRQAGAKIVKVEHDERGITVTAGIRAQSSRCPLCHTQSDRVHSRYVRSPMDLPCDGRRVRLHLAVRRFFCVRPACRRKVFAERVPSLVDPHRQRTTRLDVLLTHVGLALGGEAGSRLAHTFHAKVSPDTLLRLILRVDVDRANGPLRAVGVDDWAWRRGRRYGTIICDLERHRPIDLLADATVGSLSEWLRLRPSIEIVSRDRAGAYAEGTGIGAPQAVQVADRWHLLKNLGEATERYLGTVSLPPIVVETSAGAQTLPTAGTSGPGESDAEQPPPDARRRARYDHVIALFREMKSIRAVAKATGLNRKTVRKYLDAPAYPERKPRRQGRSMLDPYRDYLGQRWEAGCHNGAQLFRELKALGYPGSRSLVKTYVAKRRAGASAAPKTIRPSPKTIQWLFTRPRDALTDDQRTYLDELFRSQPQTAEIYALVQEFRDMFARRDPDHLYPWLTKATNCGVRAFRSFAMGLHRDKAAVDAALTYPWSNGQVEGHINRLKVLKRQMYGRAGIELLRRRFLAAN